MVTWGGCDGCGGDCKGSCSVVVGGDGGSGGCSGGGGNCSCVGGFNDDDDGARVGDTCVVGVALMMTILTLQLCECGGIPGVVVVGQG